jgi:hypothetical protein
MSGLPDWAHPKSTLRAKRSDRQSACLLLDPRAPFSDKEQEVERDKRRHDSERYAGENPDAQCAASVRKGTREGSLLHDRLALQIADVDIPILVLLA